ncbi:tetratricopeptide repeat protein [Planctomicrobium sp. SH661]|uniref:tetratricopeptide repeat protein n=1 Tax=Planctomicrobium sp. SH661 TaxID=3448124 RepID=UPI003F5BBE81
MDEPQDHRDSVDQQLAQLAERSEQLYLDCKLRSALRVSKESARLARTEGRVINYMHGLFDMMRFGHGLLDPQMTREAAVELVVLLQDEEQARRIQPDLDEPQYNWICAWMSSCAYDNLAEATGLMAGYNSPGMHECINEGIQVCRQTGKTECIKCFREYAADVYLAGDDTAMVRHQCQMLLDHRDDDEQRDRRWAAHQKLGWINLQEGRLLKAEADLEKALALCSSEKVYLKLRSSTLVSAALDEVRLLLEKKDQLTAPTLPADFDVSEWPRMELERAKVDALQAVLAGNFEEATEILTEWDRRLTELRCLKDWFEIRLRLVAAYLLAGNRRRAEALAKGLEAKAQEAQDHFTLRRWQRLMDPNNEVCPIPLLAKLDPGPDAGVIDSDAMDDAEAESVKGDADIVDSGSPLSGVLADYMQQILAAQEDEQARRKILNSILSHEPASVEEAGDAAYLVHLSRYVADGTDDALRIWKWADRMRRKFAEDAVMLNVVASLGHYFRTADADTFHELISNSDLEQWFRLSLSLNPNHPRNYARAGSFFLDEGFSGDAEQCFARAFRLDRTEGAVAHQLADIYRETERPRDALAVLDICLRKGTTDANVAWEAAMTALQLNQYDMLLTYLDRYEVLAKQERTWLHYYRGLALFRLGRFEECLLELDEELRFDPPGRLHLHVIRLCALDRLGDTNGARAELEEFLKLRFVDVDYLSLHGLVRLSEALCDAIQDWPQNDPLRRRVARRLLRAGLLSDDFLNDLRQENEESAHIRFFRVQVRQPLDSTWPDSEGCLAGQQGWNDYLIDWGVLAETESEAIDRVLELQNVCENVEATVVHADGGEETFRERPGVVWQGYRRNEADRQEEVHGGEA